MIQREIWRLRQLQFEEAQRGAPGALTPGAGEREE